MKYFLIYLIIALWALILAALNFPDGTFMEALARALIWPVYICKWIIVFISALAQAIYAALCNL